MRNDIKNAINLERQQQGTPFQHGLIQVYDVKFHVKFRPRQMSPIQHNDQGALQMCVSVSDF